METVPNESQCDLLPIPSNAGGLRCGEKKKQEKTDGINEKTCQRVVTGGQRIYIHI